MDPATAMVLAAVISAAAQGGMGALGASREKKLGKLKAKEVKRETYGNLLSDTQQRNAELEGQRLQSGARLSQGRARKMSDTSALIRSAFGL